MFQLDILTDHYEWIPYYQTKEIDLISDALICLTENDPNRTVRLLYKERVIEFLTANEKDCEYFIQTYINSNTKLSYTNELYSKTYKRIVPQKKEPTYVKVKFKNKMKKVRKK